MASQQPESTVEFIQRAEGELRALRSESSDLEEEERRIAQRRQQIAHQIESLVQSIAVYRRVMGLPPGPEAAQAALPLVRGSLRTATIHDACQMIMEAQGGQATVTSIIDALRRAGKLGKGKRGNYGTVVQAMKRYPGRFYKIRPGLWGLVSPAVDKPNP